MSILYDLYRRSRLSFHKQSPCVYAFPPVRGIVACVRVGGGGFELHKHSANENRTKLHYCNFPEILPIGKFFSREREIFSGPGKIESR